MEHPLIIASQRRGHLVDVGVDTEKTIVACSATARGGSLPQGGNRTFRPLARRDSIVWAPGDRDSTLTLAPPSALTVKARAAIGAATVAVTATATATIARPY